MKKTISILLLLMVFAFPLQVSAQAIHLSPYDTMASSGIFVAVGENRASVSFADLGYRDSNLISPFDSTRVFFNLPQNLLLVEGGEIELNFDVILSGSDANIAGDSLTSYGGLLTVTFNNQILGSVKLEQSGSQSVKFPIPLAALQVVRQDGRHQLTISLDAQLSCTYDTRTLVTIKSSSVFNLAVKVSTPELNLSKLPAPFYLRNSLLPDHTFVVLPDDPSTGELQAAFNVMAGFGARIGHEYGIDLTSIGQLTADGLAANNLVFVGKPEHFPQLEKVKFQLPVVNGKFSSLPEASSTDGVIQLALSPWNASKVVLFVSGNADDAVEKAGQAISSGPLFIYDSTSLSYVRNIQLLSDTLPTVENFTLKSLGYSDETLSGIGQSSVDYIFRVSKEQLASQDGSINMIYYHSGLLDYGNSSFSVEINNQIVVSAALSKDSEQVTNLQIKIPPGLLRFGENRLTVTVNMVPNISCDTTGFSDPWFTISDQTSFQLPASPAGVMPPAGLLDLRFYLNLFTTHSELGDVAFVVPRTSPINWAIAGKLAYFLGQTASPMIVDLKAAYADDVSQEIKDLDSLIFIGRSSTLPLLAEINDKLPAPFDLASDMANERQMQIVYRIPAGVSVGYLELATSPFNAEKSILVVAGNTEGGVSIAGNTLVAPILRAKLAGLFVVTNGVQVATSTGNALFSAVGDVVPGAQQVVATSIPAPIPAQSRFARPAWLLLLFVVSIVAIFAIFVFTIRASLKSSRKTRTIVLDDDLSNHSKS